MKNLRFAAFTLFAVYALSVPALAQKRWTYEADNGREGRHREEVTITITQKSNGYEVSGEWRLPQDEYALEGRVACPIHGQYFPTTGRLHARANCKNVKMKPSFTGTFIQEVLIDGFKGGPDRLQLTIGTGQEWEAVAWLNGVKRKQTGTRIEIPQRMEEKEGGFTATWTLLPSGNQFHSRWSNGADANLTIEKFDSEGVRIVRGDTAASVSQGFSAVYTGTISGNSVSGKVKFTQNGQTWEGTWSATW